MAWQKFNDINRTPSPLFRFSNIQKGFNGFSVRLDSVLFFVLFKHINGTVKTTSRDSLKAC